VPHGFGQGITIPLLKDKSGHLSDLSNYRAITVSPAISKLFEIVILNVCQEYLTSDDLQFGFKPGIGCAEAIYTLRTTVDYFNAGGSTVFAASLDISKAYDKINNFRLFSVLIKAGLPKWLIDILLCWYEKLVVRVRWNGSYSYEYEFYVKSGVRQGSSLSPSLFNVFVNKFLVDVKQLKVICNGFSQN